MLKGLYKVEMHTVHGSRRGVLYFYDGKMMGGSSAFAFIGTFKESASGEVLADMLTLRHNEDRKAKRTDFREALRPISGSARLAQMAQTVAQMALNEADRPAKR